MKFLLDLLDNLSPAKVISLLLATITITASVTWQVATRITDSKADYVNMRYGEISSLQEQISKLQIENDQLKQQLPNSNQGSSNNSHSSIAMREVKAGGTDVELVTGLIVSVTKIDENRAYITLSFPDGKSSDYWRNVGNNENFVSGEKEYKFVLTEIIDGKSIKYLVKEIQKTN